MEESLFSSVQTQHTTAYTKMNFKSIFIILMNILYVCSSPYLNHIITKRSRYCGSTLTNTLTLICNGLYPAGPHKKSIADILNFNDYETDYASGDSDNGFPFISKELATSLVPQKMRRNGVVDECCYKPCSITELRSYCAK